MGISGSIFLLDDAINLGGCWTMFAWRLTLCTCKTEVSKEWYVKSGLASVVSRVTLDVTLAYSGSGVCANLYFGTMESNGGTTDWEALKRWFIW